MNGTPPPLMLEVPILEKIPLRYYRGWTIWLNTRTETFESPLLNLFGFVCSRDLEKAVDASGRAT